MGAPGLPSRLWEEEMLAEYLATHFRAARTMHRVRLGPPRGNEAPLDLSDAERRLVGNAWRRWADALVIERDRLTVIEAAMLADPGDISRLELYLLLIPFTPELREFDALPRRGLLVFAVSDPFTETIARKAGLQVDVYKPSNFGEWIQTKRVRENAPRKVRAPATPESLVKS